MKIRPGNAQHQGAREYQQDSFAFSDLDDREFVAHGGVLAVVADGMGGLAHGGAAGAMAVRAFLQRYQAKPPDEPIADALRAALDAANVAVLDVARSAAQVGNVGATLVAAVVHQDRLHWTSVGDSRAYLLRNGGLEQLTLDHVYGAELDLKAAAGTLGEQEARTDPDRDALTSHLGTARLTLIERSVRPLPLEPGDRVFLCTDGVYRALPSEEMARVLAGNPQRACEEVIDRIVAKNLPAQDNLTALALAFDGDGATIGATMNATMNTADPTLPPMERRRESPRFSMAMLVALLLLLSLVFAVAWRLLHRPVQTVVNEKSKATSVARPPGGGPPAESNDPRRHIESSDRGSDGRDPASQRRGHTRGRSSRSTT